MQREIDNILQEVRKCTLAYVNDIICEAKSLFELFQKLYIFFNIFLEYNILIKPTKLYLNYLDVGLLGQ